MPMTEEARSVLNQSLIAHVAEQVRREVRRTCGDSENVTRDPFKAASVFGISVRCLATSHGAGRLCRCGSMWVMFLSTIAPPPAQRFSCAHELGHYLRRAREDLLASWPGPEEDKRISPGIDEERFCNAFAHELLMPSEDLVDYLANNTLTLDKIWGIVTKYQTPLRTTAIRLSSLVRDYAFLLARESENEPRKGELAIVWSAAPSGVFLPRHKRVPSSSCISSAFRGHRAKSEIEQNPFGLLRGSYYVEARPLEKTEGVFAMIHLNKAFQFQLPLHDERQASLWRD